MKSLPLWPIPVGLLLVFALLSTACGSVRQAALNKQKENDLKQLGEKKSAEQLAQLVNKQKENDLKQLGLAYANYCDLNPGKGPTKAEDLLPMLENNSLLMQKAKSEYTFIWGVNLSDAKQFEKSGRPATVLGYETTVPTAGGLVLMADASVRRVTAAEFANMPQAKATPTTGTAPKKK